MFLLDLYCWRRYSGGSTLHPKTKNRSAAIIFVTVLPSGPRADKLVPSGVVSSCASLAPTSSAFVPRNKPMGVGSHTCRGRYTMTICPHVTPAGNRVVPPPPRLPRHGDIRNVRVKIPPPNLHCHYTLMDTVRRTHTFQCILSTVATLAEDGLVLHILGRTNIYIYMSFRMTGLNREPRRGGLHRFKAPIPRDGVRSFRAR